MCVYTSAFRLPRTKSRPLGITYKRRWIGKIVVGVRKIYRNSVPCHSPIPSVLPALPCSSSGNALVAGDGLLSWLFPLPLPWPLLLRPPLEVLTTRPNRKSYKRRNTRRRWRRIKWRANRKPIITKRTRRRRGWERIKSNLKLQGEGLWRFADLPRFPLISPCTHISQTWGSRVAIIKITFILFTIFIAIFSAILFPTSSLMSSRTKHPVSF